MALPTCAGTDGSGGEGLATPPMKKSRNVAGNGRLGLQPFRMMLAAFWPIIIAGALVLPPIRVGMIEA